ncbi:hypothetical protein DWF00_03950 [Bosea caraganae]|uniref:Uncharacterized protein n=2 Tax=Bosea caraganae TaxID=2763117 RepID=A0A370L590_9HYPH|nr:hypothetical protein DWE98_15180 [Bosea caraganae]RDJ30284.1 hypothetical protein DWF00_03950 [Bosea caraganae]
MVWAMQGKDFRGRHPALDSDEEENMSDDVMRTVPPRAHERWFDLCFRLIILALAGFWLLMPPAGVSQRPAGDVKAAETTR